MLENSGVLFSTAPLIVLMPFLVGAIIILFARFNKTLSMALSVGAVTYGFFHSLLLLNALSHDPHLGPWQTNIDWFVSSSFKISMGVLVDNLAAVMLIVVCAVSLLVQIYTHGYMREDPGYSRFYAYLSLFTGSMLGLVVSTNLFEMYFFWELVGVCSYFLIGFWWFKPTAAAACLKAFVVNRVGDFGFLVGILMFLGATYGFWQGHSILAFVDPQSSFDLTGAIKWAASHGTLTTASLAVIAIIMFMGPMAKSAQAPLHVWLPDAMEGPTPISALIHAATMVAAGVYLVARAYPIWLTVDGSTQSVALAVVAWVGGFTAFMAATIALSQFDIKRALAWSTVSQLGYMFVGLGVGAYSSGMFHLFNHAFFKAMLFLCSGAVIHGLHGEQDMRQMGGLWKKMPITAWCFLIGTISISGVPGFSGFFSKDAIIDKAMHFNVGPAAGLIGPLMLLTAFMTAFYMFRMFFMTFTGEYRGKAHPHESPLVMTAPLMVLAVPSIISGYLGVNPQALLGALSGHAQALPDAFTAFLHHSFLYLGAEPEFEVPNVMGMAISTVVAGSGIALAFLVYTRGLAINNWVKQTMPQVYQFSFNKWYFDELYMGIIQKIILPVYTAVWTLVDKMLIDGMIDGTSMATVGSGEALKYTENGRGQNYAMVIFACVAGLSLVFYFCNRG